jgi:opacity protein-like surface antigen
MNYFKLSNVLLLPVLGCGLVAGRVNAADSGWILSGDVGPSFVNTINTTTTEIFTGIQTTTHLAFKTGVRLDLDAGYQFGDSWTLEGEFGYIYNPVNLSLSTGTTSPSLYQIPVLANCIFTLPVHWPVKPYVGAGVGLVVTGLNDLHDLNGAGQLLAGLKYDINDRVDVGVGYKLLITTPHDWDDIIDNTQGDRSITHAIVASVTIKF